MIPVRVFPEWQGQDLEGILRACQDLLEDTDFPTARRWREAGGKISKDPFEFPGGRRFQFLDPAGNELGVWSER